MVGIVTDKYGLFDINDVKGKMESYNRNRKSFGWNEDFKSKLLVCFVSESINHLQLTIDMLELLKKNNSTVTYDRLHLNKKYICADLIREDGAEIWFYDTYGNTDEGQIFSTHKF
jgi:hypothetical protein